MEPLLFFWNIDIIEFGYLISNIEFNQYISIDDSKKFLNPISHATDFIGLKKAMEDKMFLRNYLTEKFQESHLNKYLAALATGDIVFQQIIL